MADPNRKINLDLPSDEEDNSSSPDEEIPLDPEEITLVKEFEEEFKHRFTENDKVFTEFCNQKPKPPPIVFPFDSFHHNRGGGRGRGRFQGGRGRFQGQRYNNHQNWNRNRDNNQQQHYKRSRNDDYNSGS
jgi:hypothetical protein